MFDEDHPEDVFDRFTDPVKKKKKRVKNAIKKKEKEDNIFMSGRELSMNHFNTPMDRIQFDLLKSKAIRTVPIKDLEDLLRTSSIQDLNMGDKPKDEIDSDQEYGPIKNKSKRKRKITFPVDKGLGGVFSFIIVAGKCNNWLQEKLKSIGWKENMTNYNPISSSHSIIGVKESTIECFKMACKQMIRFQETTINKSNNQ